MPPPQAHRVPSVLTATVSPEPAATKAQLVSAPTRTGTNALACAVPLLASVYLPMPAIGPFPPIDEPVWYLEKVLSLAAELAVPALWLLRRIAPPAH